MEDNNTEYVSQAFDNASEFTLSINTELSGFSSSFVEQLQRIIESDLEGKEALLVSESATYYEGMHRYLADTSMAQADIEIAAGNDVYAEFLVKSAEDSYAIADGRLQTANDHEWLSNVSINASHAAKAFGFVGDVFDVSQVFAFLYEGDINDEITVTVNQQETNNVTLVLSAYNAVSWKLSGEGLVSISNIYLLGYQSGTVDNAPAGITPKVYSFENDNYIGTLSEWPDVDSDELSEQEKQQSLVNIEAVTGEVTSYGVVYSANGFEVN